MTENITVISRQCKIILHYQPITTKPFLSIISGIKWVDSINTVNTHFLLSKSLTTKQSLNTLLPHLYVSFEISAQIFEFNGDT
jgi:hypothetical protein